MLIFFTAKNSCYWLNTELPKEQMWMSPHQRVCISASHISPQEPRLSQSPAVTRPQIRESVKGKPALSFQINVKLKPWFIDLLIELPAVDIGHAWQEQQGPVPESSNPPFLLSTSIGLSVFEEWLEIKLVVSGRDFKKDIREKKGCQNAIGASQLRGNEKGNLSAMMGLFAPETQQSLLLSTFHQGRDSNISPQLPPAACAVTEMPSFCQQPVSCYAIAFANYRKCSWPRGRSTRLLLRKATLAGHLQSPYQICMCVLSIQFSNLCVSMPNTGLCIAAGPCWWPHSWKSHL